MPLSSYIRDNTVKAWEGKKSDFKLTTLIRNINMRFRITLASLDNPGHNPSITETLAIVHRLKGPDMGFFCNGLDENVSYVDHFTK